MIGKLTSQLLLKKGAHVLVTIRQYHSGIVDTPSGVERIDYDRRYQIIPECDYIFSATSSPNLTITKEKLSAAHLVAPKVFVDLAVPRDIEPGIEELNEIIRYDMDSFQIDEVSQELKEAFAKAEQILHAAFEEYEKWYEARDVVPQLLTLSSMAAEDVLGRLEKPLKEASVYEDEMLKKAIRKSAGKVVGKLLFGIRDSVDAQTLRNCLTAMEGLYVEEGEQS
jgi:glutamyl-tRNA reductase